MALGMGGYEEPRWGAQAASERLTLVVAIYLSEKSNAQNVGLRCPARVRNSEDGLFTVLTHLWVSDFVTSVFHYWLYIPAVQCTGSASLTQEECLSVRLEGAKVKKERL